MSATSRLGVPKNWTAAIQAALLQVIALARYACTRVRADHSASSRTDQLEQEVAWRREAMRLKDARMERIPAAQRPHYQPTERLSILELRAACGWSLAQTARVFQVTTATIASWTQRLDDQGPQALLAMPTPVNKFPDFVAYIVQRLQVLCPELGKVKLAQILARAGLHLSATTVDRLRRSRPVPTPAPRSRPMPSAQRVTAQRPNQLWHVDLTTVPITGGFWVPWLPFALPQCWPFCWWLAVVLDHYSRRAVGFAVFATQPTAAQIRSFLGRVVARIGTAPQHLVSDRGPQFTADTFRRWCKRQGIRQRFGAVGQRGSIAVVERFIGTLKRECTRRLSIVSLGRRLFHREVSRFIDWYNGDRPHDTLAGATPDEVYAGARPANRRPRFEPRPGWPRGSPCARPQVLVRGQPGVRLELDVDFVSGRRHLPRVTLRRAA